MKEASDPDRDGRAGHRRRMSMKQLIPVILSAVLLGNVGWGRTVYVAPDGNDEWTGLTAKWDGRKEGPVASLRGARDAVLRL